MRLFISINLPDSIREKIRSLQEELSAFSDLSAVRWVPEQNLHITLCFLGDVEESKLPLLKDVMKKAVHGIEEFEVSFKGLGVFPPKGNKRILWLGCIDKSKNIINIKNVLETGLADTGFKADKKEFKPHITLARFSPPRKIRIIPMAESADIGSLRLTSISLMMSRTYKTGAVYEEIMLEYFS